jgi:diacylglycerol O-acyltransferase
MVDQYPVFARRAVRRGRNWRWEDDPAFTMERHVEVVQLPAPVSVAAVQTFMSEQRSAPLPQDRARWVAYLINDVVLPDGSAGTAVVMRFHHAIADGVRLTQVMLGLCDSAGAGLEAVVSRSGPPGAVPDPVTTARHAASGVGHGAAEAAAAALRALRHPVETVERAPSRLQHSVAAAEGLAERVLGATRLGRHGVADGIELLRHPDRLMDALEVLGVADHRTLNDMSSVTKLAFAGSPRTVWSGNPGTEKAITWTDPIPLARVKQIGKDRGATVNDVLLAAIAGALRRYLLEHGGMVEEVYWMVPVNLKPFADNLPEDLGNYFALVVVPMPLHHESVADRLAHMHAIMQRIKHSDEAVITFGLQRAISVSPSALAFFLTNFFANKAVGILTNVPGPSGELTFGGMPVTQIIGFAPCSGNQPMTTTIFSYRGEVTIGFATDAGLIPDPQALAEEVVAELAAMA